ncbi:MAG: DUF2911 domain-containing protein [Cytophagales bacterium]|nr:DUF2911 domain-containing protein [Cytophagales bacterium]
MKALLILLATTLLSGPLLAQPISGPPSGDNQKSSVTQWIGPVEVTIRYNSPDVHDPSGQDRTGKIWGTSVAHYEYIDQGFGPAKAAPWRAGANENTTFTVSHDVLVEGKELKAGTYGLFLAVQKEGPWTWIFSKNSTSWGSYFYNQAEDALRVDVATQDGPYTEYLTFGFDERKANSAVAYLQWEKKKIPFRIEVPKINELYLSQIRQELRSSQGFDYRNFSNAAQFCVRNNTNLEEALAWSEAAMDPNIGGVEDFSTLQTKSMVLSAMGKAAEANTVMDKAVKLPSATVTAVHQYGRTLLAAGEKERAIQIFQHNAKTHPEEKFTPNVGLARAYAASGDKKKAVKYWDLALRNLPENQKINKAYYEGELKKVKEEK